MLREGDCECGRCLPQFGNTQSYRRSEDKNRGMAGRMHESRLHEGKPADLPEPFESNSFRRAVRSIKSAVQKDSRHDENPDLIPLLFSQRWYVQSRRGKIPARFFVSTPAVRDVAPRMLCPSRAGL